MKIVWQKMVPELDVSNFSASLAFYTDILGFKVLHARRDPEFVYLEQEHLQLMLMQEKDKHWLGGTLENLTGAASIFRWSCRTFNPSTNGCSSTTLRSNVTSKTRGERREVCSQVSESFGCKTRTATCCGFVSP